MTLILPAEKEAPPHTLKQQLFAALPQEFDRQTYLQHAQALHIPTRTADRHLSHWKHTGKLQSPAQGKYKKGQRG